MHVSRMRALAISELLRVRNGNASLCSSSLPFSNAHLPGACVNHKVGLMAQTWSLFGKWYNGRCTRCVLYCFMTCAPTEKHILCGHLLAKPGQYYHSSLQAESGSRLKVDVMDAFTVFSVFSDRSELRHYRTTKSKMFCKLLGMSTLPEASSRQQHTRKNPSVTGSIWPAGYYYYKSRRDASLSTALFHRSLLLR